MLKTIRWQMAELETSYKIGLFFIFYITILKITPYLCVNKII